jgi:dimethylargininase
VRRPGPRLSEGLLTHLERRPIDLGRARAQHAGYVAALERHGWQVVEVAPADDHPDAVFVEDTVVVVEDLAVITRPGAAQRRDEVRGTAAAVRGLGLRVARMVEPGRLDGGDVLQVGEVVYVGVGGRTTRDGVAALSAAVAPLGRRVVPVPLGEVLHLKSAMTALPDGSLVGLADLVDASVLPPLRRPPEQEGAHVVALGGDVVLLAASAPRTAEWLTGLGWRVEPVEIGEFEKREGCVTCLSVLVPGDPARVRERTRS